MFKTNLAMILQLERQLEIQLMRYDLQHYETHKLLLHYVNLASSFADTQSIHQSIDTLTKAYKKLFPQNKSITSQFSNQHWRLLIVIAIKLSKSLEIDGQLQQGLNILIQLELLIKQNKKSLEWANQVNLQELYYIIAKFWDKLQNKEKKYYAANECILLIKSQKGSNHSKNQLKMLIQMLEFQIETKNSINNQILLYSEIYKYQKQLLGDENQETQKTLFRIKQIKQQILFELEIEDLSKIEFTKSISKQESFKLIKDKIKPSVQIKKNTDLQNLIKPSQIKQYQRRSSFHSINRNNSQSQTSFQNNYNFRNSVENLKKLNDQTTNTKLNSRTLSQGENQFYYFMNCNNQEERNKTDMTQFQTIHSKNPNQPISSCFINRQNQTQSNLDDKNFNIDQNIQILNLMLQRPKMKINQQNQIKHSQYLNLLNSSKNKTSSFSVHPIDDPLKKILKKINTQEFNNSRKNQQVIAFDLSTKKSNQVIETIHQLTSKKSINILGDLIIQQNQFEYYENNMDKILRIQRYVKRKIDSIRIKNDLISKNKEDNEEKMSEKPSETVVQPKIFRNVIRRSLTSSVESLKFNHRKEAFLQPKKFQMKSKDFSFYSQASSNLMNIKSESEIYEKEKTQESQQYQKVLEILNSGFEYKVQGECNFFCSDQSDQILRFIGFKTKIMNNQLVFSFTIEKLIRSYQIYLPIQFVSQHWLSLSQFDSLSFCQSQLEEFIEQNLTKISQASFILMYKGDNFDENLASIIQLFSIIMVNTCEQTKIIGKKLYFTNKLQVKYSRKLLQSYYQKQRSEKRQYYFKPQNLLTDDFSMKITLRVSQTDLNVRESIENCSQKMEEKIQNGNAIYTIKTNPIFESVEDNKPVGELILLEEPQISCRQMLDVSIRDPEINQIQLKAVNIPKNLQQNQNQEIQRFSPQLLSISKIKYPQRNQSAFIPTSQKKKDSQVLEPGSFQRKVTKNHQTSVQFVEESPSSQSQKSMVSLNNQSKYLDLQFPSLSQSASLSFQPPLTSFHKKNVANISSSQQGIFSSGHNLLDTQINLIGNELFDTDALKIIDLIPEYENELDQKFITVFKKCDDFTVSSKWKKTRKVRIQNFDFEYFWNQSKYEKQIFKSIYNNPFNLCEIILIGIIKIEKYYFIVSVSQILKENIELFNQQVMNMKDLVKIQITFELIFPYDNVWKDQANFTFKEFIKWFVPDFELSLYVQKFGLSQLQKISALKYLSRFAHIKDSKLKFEFYEEQKNRSIIKNIQRRTLEIQRIEVIESIFLRDKIDISYFSNLGLEQLYQDLLKDREKNNFKQKKRDIRYQAFLQLTNPSKLDPITQIPKFIGLDYEGEFEEKTIQMPNYKELKLLQQYNTLVLKNQKKQIFRHYLTYYIWNNGYLKIWRPFQRKIWQQIQIQNKEKLLNTIQCRLRNYFLNQLICKTLSLNGKKLMQKQYFKQDQYCNDQNLLYNYFQLVQFTNQQFYQFLTILYYQLFKSDQFKNFWDSFFIQYKKLSHSKIAQLGYCLLEITIFFDKPKGILKQLRRRYILIKVNLFCKKNMKTKMYKLILTLEDLQNTLNKLYDVNHYNIIEILFNDIQILICNHLCYERFINSRHAIIIIRNIKQGKTLKFINSLPWVLNFNYDNLDVTPYPKKFQLFYQEVICSRLIYNMIQFIQLPFCIVNRYQYNKIYLQQSRIPCIIIIEEFQDIKTYLLQIYIPKSCRRFITNLHFNQINTLSDMSLEIISENSQTQTKKQGKQWQDLIKSFKFSMNQERKLLLKIEKIQTEQILQEVLCYKIKSVRKTKEAILFKMFVEYKRKQGFEYSNFHFPMKITEAKDINMVLQLQWLNQQDKIQSYKLPLYEQLMGYFDKYFPHKNIFDFKFRIIDLIKMSEIQVESILINYSLNIEAQNNNLDFQMSHQIHKNECRIKLNINLRILQINKSGFKLLFRGVLMVKPQILVGIYEKQQKTKLYFQIQRVNDGQQFMYKVQFEDIDNQFPGFNQNLKMDQRGTGAKIFRMFRRKLIYQCQYQLN